MIFYLREGDCVKRVLYLISIVFMVGCSSDSDSSSAVPENVDYRGEMRRFVVEISEYAKSRRSSFAIVPQNGQELITHNGDASGTVQDEYLAAIDATGREDMYYGYYGDDILTPTEDAHYLEELCLLCEKHGVEVLATDYCSTQSSMDHSYELNSEKGFISFAADQRDLTGIPHWPPAPYNENSENISSISRAKNFLYLINSEKFTGKESFISTVSAANYDLLIMDMYHWGEAYTPDEVALLKKKQNGGDRIVLCYMSIGEAEEYRNYWREEWRVGNPSWLEREDPNWEGNYYVQYWDRGWKSIIYGSESSYLDRIIAAGFDGVYLDLIDAFEYFEGEVF